MKIVVTDGYTLNSSGLSWAELEKLGEFENYDYTSAEQTLQRCKDADIVITNKVVFDESVMQSLPNLKFITVTATGHDIIDIQTARRKHIPVSNVPAYSTHSVAQMVFAHILELAFHIGHHSETVKQGKWSNCENFCYWDRPLTELAGLTIGIIGFGKIGQATARLADAFGMNIIAYHTHEIHDAKVEPVALERLFAASDIVSLHCPLKADNEKMVNADMLRLMKPTAWLINTSRGQLVDERALVDALNNGQIAGAGLDVLATEPPEHDNPLLSAKNCYITPHMAWGTQASLKRLMGITIGNVKGFIDGNPQNLVTL